MANLADDACKVTKETSEDCVIPVYPIVLDSVKTSVVPRSASDSSDEEDDEDDSEEWADQLAMRNDGLPPGSTVQIENSTDVVIGPVTQFHGPVTIYQNVQTQAQLPQIEQKKSNLEFTCSPEKSNLADNSSPRKYSLIKLLEKSPTKRLLLYSFLALSTLVLVAFGIVWSLKMFDKTDANSSTSDPTPKPRDEVIIPNVRTYTKDEWRGDAASGEIARLSLPVEYVVIAHSAGSFCETFADCSYLIRNIQNLHMKKQKDIWYNFLIGGDGAIYYGRGWDLRSTSGDNAIIVTVIGNFQKRQLTSSMLSALRELLTAGLSLQKLASDYKLVCHNQTKATESPGAGAYEIISKMPHFYDGGVNLKQSDQ